MSIPPILQVKKLRNGDVNWLSKGHMVNLQGLLNWNLCVIFYIPEDMHTKVWEKHFSYVLYTKPNKV